MCDTMAYNDVVYDIMFYEYDKYNDDDNRVQFYFSKMICEFSWKLLQNWN